MATASRFTLRSLLLLAVSALVTACVGGPPKPVVDYQNDYNFSPVKKIAFYRDSGKVSGDNPMQLSDMQRDRIDRAVGETLAEIGYEVVRDEGDADLLVSWHLVTQHQTDVRSSPGYGIGYGLGYGYRYGSIGYRGGYGGYSPYSCGYGGGYGGGYGSQVYSSNYTKGKFIVDMIDPTTDKSVWRGITESRLKKDPVKEQGQYNAAAAVMLEAFPPT